MGYVNGTNAQNVIRYSAYLLGLLIVAITVIIVTGQEVPQDFSTMVTLLVGGLVGLLAGTRVIPPDISAEIKAKQINKMGAEEQEHLKKILTGEKEQS